MAFQYIGMMIVRIAHWKHSKMKKVSLYLPNVEILGHLNKSHQRFDKLLLLKECTFEALLCWLFFFQKSMSLI